MNELKISRICQNRLRLSRHCDLSHSVILMSYSVENVLLARLKQSLAERQYGQRFAEIVGSHTRINPEPRQQLQSIQPALLPSISHSKASIAPRLKSQSAKRLPPRQDQQKPSLNKGTQRGIQEAVKSKIELGGNSIRTKAISMRSFQKDSGQTVPVKTDRKQAGKDLVFRIEKYDQQLLLTVRMGLIDSESPGVKKALNQLAQWKASNSQEYPRVWRLWQKLGDFVKRYRIAGGNVDWQLMMQLSSRKVISNYQMVGLFLNKNEISQHYRICGLQYYTKPQDRGLNLAACKITAFFRGIFSRRFYSKFKSLIGKVKVIQRYWRTAISFRRGRAAVLAAIEHKLQYHRQLQKNLTENWGRIKTSQRVEIHICSYSMQEFKRIGVSGLRQKENSIITRLFRASEPDLFVIYVLPLPLPDEVLKYYYSLFGLASPSMRDRVTFVEPENAGRLEDYGPLSTATLLLYSPKAMKRIRQLVAGRPAYIVPWLPSIELTNLSAELGLPILAPSQSLAKLYSSKSGSMKILGSTANRQKSCFQVEKTVSGIYSQKELINSLAVLIIRNRDIRVWYLKIDDEIEGKGNACLHINKIALLRELYDDKQLQQEEAELIKLVAAELTAKLPIRLKILNKSIYSDYRTYLSHFLTRGGLIQAERTGIQFSLSFFIEPDGQFRLIGSYSKLELGGRCMGAIFPSQANIDTAPLLRQLYKELWVKYKLFGYFSADFIYSEGYLPSAIGLDCFLNTPSSSLALAFACANVRYEKEGNWLRKQDGRPLHYLHCPIVPLARLPTTSAFFRGCKFENVAFDLELRMGTLILLLDRTESQQLGVICLQQDRSLLMRQLSRVADYFSREYREGKGSHDPVGLLKGLSVTWLKRQRPY